MTDPDQITRYNYDAFVPAKFMPLMRFDKSPALGQPASDFPLWTMDEAETSLRQVISQHLYTIVEFGSFT